MISKNKKLVLRTASDAQDLTRYEQFLYDNPDKKLPIPTRREIENAFSTGGIYIIEDEQGEIVAGAGLFLEYISETVTRDYTIETSIFEFGGSRVTRAAGGTRPYKVQEIFYALRILKLLAEQSGPVKSNETYRTKTCFLAAVRADNLESISGTLNSGLTPIESPPTWLKAHEAWALGNGVAYFVLPASQLSVRALALKAFIEAGSKLERDDLDVPGAVEQIRILWQPSEMGLSEKFLAEVINGDYSNLFVDVLPQHAEPWYPHNDIWKTTDIAEIMKHLKSGK